MALLQTYSVKQACACWLPLQLLLSPVEPAAGELEQAIEQVLAEFPTYGTRRVTQQLRRAPHAIVVNRKRIQRVMRKKQWLQPVKRQKRRTTDSQHLYSRYPNLVKDLVVSYPDQVWSPISLTSACKPSLSTWLRSWCLCSLGAWLALGPSARSKSDPDRSASSTPSWRSHHPPLRSGYSLCSPGLCWLIETASGPNQYGRHRNQKTYAHFACDRQRGWTYLSIVISRMLSPNRILYPASLQPQPIHSALGYLRPWSLRFPGGNLKLQHPRQPPSPRLNSVQLYGSTTPLPRPIFELRTREGCR